MATLATLSSAICQLVSGFKRTRGGGADCVLGYVTEGMRKHEYMYVYMTYVAYWTSTPARNKEENIGSAEGETGYRQNGAKGGRSPPTPKTKRWTDGRGRGKDGT